MRVTRQRVMKGVVLHGGYGTRLRPLTHTGPKQLIPVAGKPISQYCLEDLRDAGVKDIAIVLDPAWSKKVIEYYGNGANIGISLHYILQEEPEGIAHAIGLAKEFVGRDKFVVYLGDNLLKGGISEYVQSFSSGNSDAMVLLSKIPNPERFGVAKFDEDGTLIALVEKPREPPSQFAIVGVYFFSPKVFNVINKLKPSSRGELEVTDAFQSLLTEGYDVQHRFVEGWWKDTGTPEDILEANRLILDDKLTKTEIHGHVETGAEIQGRVRVESGASVRKGSVVRGPAHIGGDTIIETGSYVGPYTSIGRNCLLSQCELENSIIMDGCRIEAKQRITDSLVGGETEIRGHQGAMPQAYRLVLGERCRLQL